MEMVRRGMQLGTLLLGVVVPAGTGGIAHAGMVDTPTCRTDLGRADALIHGIRLRERRMSRDDLPGACRLLRENLADMTQAGKLMEPCLTGHEKGENLGQINVSIGDIRQVLSRNCR